jgi:hypothetical protein
LIYKLESFQNLNIFISNLEKNYLKKNEFIDDIFDKLINNNLFKDNYIFDFKIFWPNDLITSIII